MLPVKVLVTGAAGQLGRALVQYRSGDCELLARSRNELDIADTVSVERFLSQENIGAVINAAAYTNVEAAEREPTQAYRINGEAPAALARACLQTGARLVHVSTDFVFDGEASMPYLPTDVPRPLNVYGASKLEGERQVLEILGEHACVMRTSWLYGPGGTNFVSKMLQLMADKDTLRVVVDERGSPTSTATLATALWACVTRSIGGIQHWSDAGVISRHEFAVEIAKVAHELGLIGRIPQIVPVDSTQFSSAVRRPAYSALDTRSTQAALSLPATPWRKSLRNALANYRSQSMRTSHA